MGLNGGFCYACIWEGCPFDTGYYDTDVEAYDVYKKHIKYVHQDTITVAAQEAGGWGSNPPINDTPEETTPTIGAFIAPKPLFPSIVDRPSFECYICKFRYQGEALDLNIKSFNTCIPCGRSILG